MNRVREITCRDQQAEMSKIIQQLPIGQPQILSSVAQIPKVLLTHHKKNVFLVTDKGIIDAGLAYDLLKQLRDEGIAYHIFDETVVNPTIRNVERARELYKANHCDALIAFGGGSPMDCAKALGARLANPELQIEDMVGLSQCENALPLFIAIPTTAGTGSEATIAAVITDERTHCKYPLLNINFIPAYAVLDAALTVGLPKQLTATTGMDALAHAVEAYINQHTNDFTDKKAEEAVRIIHRYLKQAYDHGDDLEARENMLMGAHYAGMSFTRAFVGYDHAIAHALGGKYGLPHGLAVAVLLPVVLEAYGDSCYQKLGTLARNCGITAESTADDVAAKTFIEWVKEMNRTMKIPTIIEEIRDEDIPQMAVYADMEANPGYPVPKLMDAKELEAVFYAVKA